MDIQIINGCGAHLNDCYEALMNSDIGRAYFTSFDFKPILLEGLENGEIKVAIGDKQECLGFIWHERHGAFGMHTYLHIIAVKESFRNMGIGKKLIADFEAETFKEDNMIFLMVADFNNRARKLYESLGYETVGMIPGFYRPDINEYLLVKRL